MTQEKNPARHPREHTDHYRLILQNVRDFAIFSADLNGLINEWNPGAERLFGYSEQEILGQHMEVLYVPEDRAVGRAELEKAQAAETGFSEDERWHLRKNGERFFVSGVVNAMYDDAGKLCGFIKVARDITPRKQLQERLTASEAHHRLILEAIKDFAIVTLDRRGVIQTWNPGAVLTYGYEASEIVGQNHALLFTAEQRATGAPEKTLAESIHEGVYQGEEWRAHKNGSHVFVIDVLRPMTDEQGRITSLLKVSRDITTRHTTRVKLEATQRELEGIRAELEQKVAHRTAALAQTVQSLELVLYHVAHDLRAPLRSMEGFSNILVQKYSARADPEAERLTDMISQAARRMGHLIHDLLIYGRLCHEPVRRDKVPLRLALDSALLELEPAVRQTGADIEVRAELPTIWGDRLVLGQVFCQVISNALSFVRPGQPPHLHIWADYRESFVRLWMEDNGVGISPEYQERIFWLFERLSHERNSSTGMGLAIARKGVERMGGRIGVESRPGAGSRFWIELPAAERET